MPFALEVTHAVPPVAVTVLTKAAVTNTAKRDVPSPAETPKKEKKISEELAQKAVYDINEYLQSANTELNFSVDKETDKMVLKIINTKTQEVIRQIPAEDALRISAKISKLLGILIDENA